MARPAAKGRKPAWSWGTRMASGSCSSPEPRPVRETPLAEPDRIWVPFRLIEAGRPPHERPSMRRRQLVCLVLAATFFSPALCTDGAGSGRRDPPARSRRRHGRRPVGERGVHPRRPRGYRPLGRGHRPRPLVPRRRAPAQGEPGPRRRRPPDPDQRVGAGEVEAADARAEPRRRRRILPAHDVAAARTSRPTPGSSMRTRSRRRSSASCGRRSRWRGVTWGSG